MYSSDDDPKKYISIALKPSAQITKPSKIISAFNMRIRIGFFVHYNSAFYLLMPN